MTNKRSTKHALLMSALALLLCVSMLVGSTYAWFTDSVTSTGNIIKSGTLEVTMEWKDATENGAQQNYKNAEEGAIFNYDKWEPGYVEAKNIKIANVGTLAFKYNLNITATGEISELANVIDVYYAEGEYVLADRNMSALTRVGTLSEVLAGMPANMTGSLKADDADRYITIALKMQESAGNDYQNKSIGSAFAVQLLATQLTSEDDSFDNQYDKNAGWTGEIAQPAWNENGGYQIGTPEELAWFAQYVNGTLPTTYAAREALPAGHNAVLTADINLNNLPWTPIGRAITAEEKAAGAHAFDYQFHGSSTIAKYAIFDGQGHTVYNLNVNETQNSGLFGAAVYAVIKNVNVDGAKIVSNHFAGTVLAQGYARVENCHVKNSTVICTTELIDGAWDNGDKVGGVVGKISESNDASSIYGVVKCSAENVNVSAYRDCGGILGYAGKCAEVTDNTVTNVTLTQDATHDYKAFDSAAKYNFNSIVGDSTREAGVEVENNVGEAEIIPMATSSKGLKEVLKNNATIYVADGEHELPTLADYEGVTLIGAEGAVIGGKSETTGFASNFGKDTTIKNFEFSGSSNGVRWSYAKGGTTTFEDCTFAGDSTYGFHIDESKGATFIFNNCTFVGFNAFAGDLEKVIFNNCTFLNNGYYGHTNIWSVAEFNDCTWGDKTSVSQGKDSGAKLYFDGVEESYHHEFIGSTESLFDFAKSVNEGGDSWNGQKVLLVDDIDLENKAWTPIGALDASDGNGNYSFNGTFDGNGHTIKNLYIGDEYANKNGVGLFASNAVYDDIVIKNLTVDGATVYGNKWVGVIQGYTYGTVKDCTVKNATIYAKNGYRAGAVVGFVSSNATSAGAATGNIAEICVIYVSKTVTETNNAVVGTDTSANAATNINTNKATDCEVIVGAIS